MITFNDQLEMKIYPIDNSLRLFRQKFALNIIQNMLLLKQKRFSQFLRSIEGINTKTLSTRLKELQEFGIIERKVTQKRPIEVEYGLTEKGKALEPVLVKLVEFSLIFEAKTNYFKK